MPSILLTTLPITFEAWFVKGKLSAADVQSAAQTIREGGSAGSSIGSMAEASESGELAGNVSRDLAQPLRKQTTSGQEVYETKMTFWCDKTGKQAEDTLYVLLPCGIIEAQIDLDMQKRGLAAPDVSAWCSLPEDSPLIETKRAWMANVGMAGNRDNVVLCGLWGDGAVYHTRDSLNLMLFNVLSGICRTRFWISAFTKRVCCQCGCKGRCTSDSFWIFLVWQ